MTRAGVKRLRRNIAVCAGATRDEDALAALDEVHEPSCDEPLVAEHIAWARHAHQRSHSRQGEDIRLTREEQHG